MKCNMTHLFAIAEVFCTTNLANGEDAVKSRPNIVLIVTDDI